MQGGRLDIVSAVVEPAIMQTEVGAQRRGESNQRSSKPRVLHVLGSLSVGGIETWLMHMLRHHQRFSVDHEILLTRDVAGEYEAEARRLGMRIHRLPLQAGKRTWLRSFRRFLETNGPFAAVHSHVYFFSARVLEVAKEAGIPVRIGHCHTARSRGSDHNRIRHKIRRQIAIRWLRRVATKRIGISEAAIEEIAGPNWQLDPRNSVLLYGLDFSRYRGAAKRAVTIREQLGISREAPVIGHVGRFNPIKNHAFLLNAFAGVLRRVPEAHLVLVGDGPTRDEIRAVAASLGIVEHVHLPGTTEDVPAYMRMFDLFVLPSFSEGLGIVVLEAQAAGTRAIVSDAVATEVAIVPGAVQFLSLSAGADAWSKIMAKEIEPRQPHRDEWLGEVELSRFAMARCIDELDGIYRAELAQSH
jgi:glycosyltransferase involved in cell wall biosynthesis